MVAQSIKEHIREVLDIADGTKGKRDRIIEESWRRCMKDYGLDPVRLKEAYIVPEHELRRHKERLEQLLRTARYGIETLYKQISGQNYVVLLTDAQGVTVDYIGNPSLKQELRKAGLYLGSEWLESRAGTNGVGCCMYTGEALVVHQTDHFDGTHAGLTCTAAPIYDINGEIAAVLDISALHSPEPKESQAMALHLVESFAHRIEMANLMASFRSDWVIRFSRSPEFLDVDPECALGVGADGCIAGMTRRAQQILADAAGLDLSEPKAIIGKPLEDFFDFDVNDLPMLTGARPAGERMIATKQGKALFAHSVLPQKPVKPSRFTVGTQKSLSHLHGGDPAVAEVVSKAARLAYAPISILIHGETGTGKEYLARAIHQMRRVPGKFVAINCAAVPETLIESELFGYEAGAFTGANSKGKKGLIEQADGGTLFLDEIGDMPLMLQARLLRVLAEKEVLKVGSAKPVSVSIRVLAATHQDLADLIKAGKFREDLYYRLNGAVLTLPPLREREDMDWIIDRLLNFDLGRSGQLVRLSPNALAILKAYAWPGNLRQLANALEFAKALCSCGVVEAVDLPEYLRCSSGRQSESVRGTDFTEGGAGADGEIEGEDELEVLLADQGWNVSHVARMLDVSRVTIHRRMKRAGIVPPNRR